MTSICPLCQKRISDWEMAGGKCTFVNNVLVHLACTKDYTPTEVAQKCQEASMQ